MLTGVVYPLGETVSTEFTAEKFSDKFSEVLNPPVDSVQENYTACVCT